MKLQNSIIIDSLNSKLAWLQEKLNFLVENSFILKNLDNIIFAFICLSLISSLFLPSEAIGIVAIAVILLTILKLILHRGQNLNLVSCNLFILIFLGLSFVSVVNSTLYLKSLYGFSKTLIYLGFYFSVLQHLRFNKDKILPLLFLIAVLCSAESVYGLIQNSLGLSNISTWQDTSYVNPEDVLSRVYGTLLPYNPNLFAGYLIVSFSSILAYVFLYLQEKKIKSFVVGSIFALISVATIVFTGCRGAYIALFSIFMLVFLASWQIVFKDLHLESLKKYWKYLTSSIIGLGLIVIVSTPSILKRILSIFIMREDSSTSFRMNVYQSSVQMFRDNWIFGIGTGNKTFREIYGLYMRSGYDALSSYCVFLEMAVESGIFALIAYLIFLYILLSSAVKSFLLSHNLRYKIVLFAVTSSIIGVMVHGIFDTIYFRPQIQLLYWIMVAIAITMITSEEKTI